MPRFAPFDFSETSRLLPSPDAYQPCPINSTRIHLSTICVEIPSNSQLVSSQQALSRKFNFYVPQINQYANITFGQSCDHKSSNLVHRSEENQSKSSEILSNETRPETVGVLEVHAAHSDQKSNLTVIGHVVEENSAISDDDRRLVAYNQDGNCKAPETEGDNILRHTGLIDSIKTTRCVGEVEGKPFKPMCEVHLESITCNSSKNVDCEVTEAAKSSFAGNVASSSLKFSDQTNLEKNIICNNNESSRELNDNRGIREEITHHCANHSKGFEEDNDLETGETSQLLKKSEHLCFFSQCPDKTISMVDEVVEHQNSVEVTYKPVSSTELREHNPMFQIEPKPQKFLRKPKRNKPTSSSSKLRNAKSYAQLINKIAFHKIRSGFDIIRSRSENNVESCYPSLNSRLKDTRVHEIELNPVLKSSKMEMEDHNPTNKLSQRSEVFMKPKLLAGKQTPYLNEDNSNEEIMIRLSFKSRSLDVLSCCSKFENATETVISNSLSRVHTISSLKKEYKKEKTFSDNSAETEFSGSNESELVRENEYVRRNEVKENCDIVFGGGPSGDALISINSKVPCSSSYPNLVLS